MNAFVLQACTIFLLGAVSINLRADTSAFLDKYCSGCHDSESRKGGLDIVNLGQPTDLGSLDLWVRIFDRVAQGEMPPKQKARPHPKEQTAFLQDLQKNLTFHDLQLRSVDGRATLRRLTRVEYENAVRDLFSMPHLELRGLFPPDGTRGSYDKVGEALDLSEIQLGVYLNAAEQILDQVICTQERPIAARSERFYPTTRKFWQALGNGDGFLIKNWQVDPLFPLVSPKVTGFKNRTEHPDFKNDEFVRRTDSFGLIRSSDPSKYRSFNFVAPVDGMYRFRVSAWSFLMDRGDLKPNARTEVASLWSGIDRKTNRVLAYFDAPSFSPKVSEFKSWLPAQSGIRFETETVRHAEADISEYVGPGVAVDWVEVDGPFFEQWPSQGHRLLFGDLPLVPSETLKDLQRPRRSPAVIYGPLRRASAIGSPEITVGSEDPLSDARKLLGRFLNRAFRRPVRPEEVDAYVGIVDRSMKPTRSVAGEMLPGMCFETAMREAYKTALCSSHFLFRQEVPGRLDEAALANRLALWLWNSIPDADLLSVAAAGGLSKPNILRGQVDRMLRDARSERFVSDFLNQWLNLAKIDDTVPDRQLYPEFSQYMKHSMVLESEAFFREMLDANLDASHLVSSSFVMINGELGRLYGVSGVDGHAIRKVELPEGSVRGGFIAQAAVHKVTANGTTTSPVLRGKWFNERILGMTIPIPPPNVGSVEPDTRGAVTVREQLDKHRRDESCAACHAQIDPPGFAMELFDVIGGERTRYRSLGAGETVNITLPGGKTPNYRMALPVECQGQLADGSPFENFGDFRKLLLQRQELLARNLLKQILEYATGSPLHFADRPAFDRLVEESRREKHGLRSMIYLIAQNELFQQK